MFTYSAAPEHIDFQGRLTVPSLCAFAVDAIATHLRRDGYGVDVMAKDHKTWVLLRSAFEIDARPGLYEPFTISVWAVSGSNGLTYTRCIRCHRASGQEFARGTTDWCVLDIASRRPVVTALKVAGERPELPCPSPLRIRAFDPQVLDHRKVGYSECDFNGHLNNIKYLQMLFDLLPDKVLYSQEGLRLDVNYRKEARRGQEICIGLKEESPEQYLFLARHGETTLCSASLRTA